MPKVPRTPARPLIEEVTEYLEFTGTTAAFASAKAEVLVRKAYLTRARINFGYTEVKAPISGRVGRNLVDVGNLVGQGETTLLTDITTYDPMYVYFVVNERDLLRVMSISRKEDDDEGRAGKRDPTPLELGLANDTGYPHSGVSDFAESQVDPDTGTFRVRGVFDNPGDQPVLFPGLFARIRVPIAKRPDMPLATGRAIGFDQSGQYVLVVSAENVIEKRSVALGSTVDGLQVVESGVEANDLVVVNGLQRAREGIEVAADEVDMATLSASAIEAAAEADEVADEEASARKEGPQVGDEVPPSGASDDGDLLDRRIHAAGRSRGRRRGQPSGRRHSCGRGHGRGNAHVSLVHARVLPCDAAVERVPKARRRGNRCRPATKTETHARHLASWHRRRNSTEF